MDPDSESQLALHAKRGKLKLTFFIACLEKCEFLQTTQNIGKLYSVLKISERRILTYQFRARMRRDEGEMTNHSYGSTFLLLQPVFQ